MSRIIFMIARIVIPWLLKKIVESTDTKADDKLLAAVMDGFEHNEQSK